MKSVKFFKSFSPVELLIALFINSIYCNQNLLVITIIRDIVTFLCALAFIIIPISNVVFQHTNILTCQTGYYHQHLALYHQYQMLVISIPSPVHSMCWQTTYAGHQYPITGDQRPAYSWSPAKPAMLVYACFFSRVATKLKWRPRKSGPESYLLPPIRLTWGL